MIYSLRNKFAASHTLPILLLMPLLSLYLLFTLEDFFTQNLLQQLTFQANLVRQLVQRDPLAVMSSDDAQNALAELAGLTDARLLILDGTGTILASTRTEDRDRLGTIYDHPSVRQALQGENAQGVGPGFFTDVAYVVLPLRSGEAITGALRLSYSVNDLRVEVNQLQLLVLGGVLLTALLALGVGLGLATTITRPLSQLAASARQIAQGNYSVRTPAPRRDEIGSLEQSFNAMALRLEELEHTRHRQLAAITHELGRPLTGMRAAVETLQDGADAQPEARMFLLAGVVQELGRMQRLVEILQRVQKRTLRPMALQREYIAPARMIRATVSNFEALANQSGITLATEIPSDLPRIYADQDRLIQVLTNLLDNAIKFTPSGGRITVSSGTVPEHIWVTVRDTGIGIAPSETPNLFQEFYQGGSVNQAERQGMGLGLTISREIIRAHGGTIQVESEPGEGARFTFTLPR